MNKSLDKKIAIVVIVLFAGLMQIHSIKFWQDTAGQWSGVAFSLALEGAMLTLFYFGRGLFLWFVKYAAALVLISGPWYVMVTPALDELSKNMEIRNKIERAEMKVDRLRGSKETYDDNSEEFRGWGGRIDRTESKLEIAERELEERYAEASGIGFEWRRHMVAGMAGSVLLIVMIAQLTLLSKLRPQPKNIPKESKDTPKLRQVSKPATGATEYDRAVEAVIRALKVRPGEFGKNQIAVADYFDIRPADITLLFKHTEKRATGSETISKVALQKMVVKLKIDKGEYQRA